jgi:hypothetical protein
MTQADDQRVVLLRLLEESLARGHSRVAIRRYFMLLIRRLEIPEPVHATCEGLIAKRGAREIVKIEAAVTEWASMLDLPPMGTRCVARSVVGEEPIDRIRSSAALRLLPRRQASCS